MVTPYLLLFFSSFTFLDLCACACRSGPHFVASIVVLFLSRRCAVDSSPDAVVAERISAAGKFGSDTYSVDQAMTRTACLACLADCARRRCGERAARRGRWWCAVGIHVFGICLV